MLENTFCHLPGVGPAKEKKLWDSGIRTWSDALAQLNSGSKTNQEICSGLELSMKQLALKNGKYFEQLLPAGQLFRLFHPFRSAAVYLDIETTGLSPWDEITTIALYDGKETRWYVNGQNLDQFAGDMKHYSLIITFNGKTFDLPFIESRLGCTLDQAHIDLRYVLAALGFKGGLKKCEKAMGIDRGELDGVDGSFAVVLWEEYIKTGNPRMLDTLLAYNIEDVINLETLMVMAYNLKAEELGFMQIPVAASQAKNPFTPDSGIVDQIRSQVFARPW